MLHFTNIGPLGLVLAPGTPLLIIRLADKR